MALIKWGDDEEDKKKDDFLQAPMIKTVASVQSGAWQPTQANANDPQGQAPQQSQSENYLVSDQKAAVDEDLRRRKAADEAARAEAARQAEIARVNEANARAAAAQEAELVPESRPKYGGNPEKKSEGFFVDTLKNIGSGLQQGIGALGDIAIQGGAVIGTIGKNDQQIARELENTEKVRAWLHGFKDLNGNNIVGTRDVEDAAGRIASGNGSFQDVMAVGGKGLQAGIDATMFINPARMALPGRFTPVVSQSASMLGRVATNPAVRYAARDAAFFGGLQGAATTAQQYGESGDIAEALKLGTQDAVVGGLLQGGLDLGGHVVGKGVRKGYESFLPAANKTINSLRGGDRIPMVENAGDLAGEALQTPQQRPNSVEDGVSQPSREPQVNDPNISFEDRLENSQLGDNSDIVIDLPPPPSVDSIASEWTPPRSQSVADGISSIRGNEAMPDTPPVSDGAAQVDPELTNVTPVEPRSMDMPETPAKPVETAPSAAPVVADGTVAPRDVLPADMPVVDGEQARALREARAGASQADEAVINQRLQEMEANAPRVDENLPDDMATDVTGTSGDGAPLSREDIVQRLMPKLADNSDVKQRIATAVDMGKDVESPIRDILRDGGVKPAQAERVATHFDALEAQLREYNRLEEMNQKAYLEGGTDALSEDVSRQRSRVTRDMGTTTRRLMQEIDRLEGSRDMKARVIRGLTDAIGTRNASVLTSAGLLERNIAQELTANAKLAIKNPIKMARSTFGNGNILGDTAKAELAHWKDAPRNPIEAMKYVVGNTYRTAMIPTTALANTRRGAVRDELTKWAYKELEGRNLSSNEAHKLAGTAGNEMEALVNTFIGVDNGMTSRGQATEALKAWKDYIRTGDDGAKAEFLKRVETHNSLADQMIAGLSKDDATRARGLMAMKNLIFPFVRTATNLMKTTVRQDINPFAKSLLDEIRADQRGGAANAINTIKSKLVDYGIMGGAAALAGAGVLAYNDGDEVDKPRGWSIKVGDNQYIPVRSTSLELPMALAGTAQAMTNDIAAGKPRDWQYYAGMVTGSLPYIDQFNTTTGAVDSVMNGEDGGYAAKAYGVNMAKSFVPFSNNGIQPYVAGKQGESLNAKSVYDENMGTWLMNTVRKSYDPDFYNSLKDSRDNAGRVRTVDNQGVVSNKTMNDANTAKYNTTITDMVRYARENGLGKNTQDMFNTYDTGKNNNFKSTQDAITFLDVADGEKPDNAKKLEQNAKLADLSRQIRDGFYGETGSELLTLDGKELKSDASAPNTTGSKNSKLPLSMQSIKNAIAQTDLGTEANDKLFEISGQKSELYAQLKAKAISYEQYSAARGQLEQAEVGILSNSENYQKLNNLMNELDRTGFFAEGGMGATKSGQTYLWNSLNALLGSKGATPAANYPDSKNGFTPWGRGGRGTGRSANAGAKAEGIEGLRWSPVGKRQMAAVQSGRYTPVNIKVKLGSAIKKDKTQNYSDRSF